MIQWIVVANYDLARIFHRTEENKVPILMSEITNPLAHEKISDLARHKPGFTMNSSGNGGGHRHRAGDKADIKDDVLDQFARTIAETINTHKTAKRFDFISIIAEPRMLGKLRGHLGSEVQTCLSLALAKDFSKENVTSLTKIIMENDDLRIPVGW